MGLRRITFTGADDATNFNDLEHLTLKYQGQVEIEWGILFSQKQGKPRYPSPYVGLNAVKLAKTAMPELRFAAHLCGAVARSFFALDGFILPLGEIAETYDRLQLNVNFDRNAVTEKDWDASYSNVVALRLINPKIRVILQLNNANKGTVTALILSHHPILAYIDLLYDQSGGRGTLLDCVAANRALTHVTTLHAFQKKEPIGHGYAGGIGPENTKRTLSWLEPLYMHPWHYDIDMESGVRDENDKFDTRKVERVLQVAVAEKWAVNL